MNQGRKANSTGKEAEDIIATILKYKGFPYERQILGGKNAFRGEAIVDFLVKGILDYEDGLIIEVKHQQSKGSVDQKFSFLAESIKRGYLYPTIVVLFGGGYRAEAEEYLRRQVGGRLVAVMGLEEFVIWMINLSVCDVPQYENLRLMS